MPFPPLFPFSQEAPTPAQSFEWRLVKRGQIFGFLISSYGRRETQLFELIWNPARAHWTITRFKPLGTLYAHSRQEAMRLAESSLHADVQIRSGIIGEDA